MSGSVGIIAGFVFLGILTIAVLIYIIKSALKESAGREERLRAKADKLEPKETEDESQSGT
jgi:hypothetical protein